MATKKTETEAAVEEAKMVTYTIPKRYKGDKYRYVTLNGERFRCKVGAPIEVPEAVAAILDQSVKQRDYFETLVEKLENEAKNAL